MPNTAPLYHGQKVKKKKMAKILPDVLTFPEKYLDQVKQHNIPESLFILMIITKNARTSRGEMPHLFYITSRKPNNNNKLTHRKPLYKHFMD